MKDEFTLTLNKKELGFVFNVLNNLSVNDVSTVSAVQRLLKNEFPIGDDLNAAFNLIEKLNPYIEEVKKEEKKEKEVK